MVTEVDTKKEEVESGAPVNAAASGMVELQAACGNELTDDERSERLMSIWPESENTFITLGPLDGDDGRSADISRFVALRADRRALEADLVAVAKKYAARYADAIKGQCGPVAAAAIDDGAKQPADSDGLQDLIFEEGRAVLKLYRQNIAGEFYAGRDAVVLTAAVYSGTRGPHEIADDVVRLVAISNRPKAVEHAVRRLAELAAELDPEFASVRPAAELPAEIRAAAREAEAQS